MRLPWLGDVNALRGTAGRQRAGMLEGVISIIVNVLLAVIKFGYGLMSRSVSLMADGLHSLSDVVTSVVVIVGVRVANRPPDEEHPFGHGRAELVSSLIVATLLFAVALEFLQSSIRQMGRPTVSSFSVVGIAVVAATLFVKELLARFAIWLGRKANAPSVIADGHHHRSDALSTVVVLLAMVGVQLGHPWMDGVAGLVVSGFIMWTAVLLIRESFSPLLGLAPDQETVARILSIVEGIPGIIGVHDLVVHDFHGIYHISLHIEVEEGMTLVQAHDLSDRVEQAVQGAFHGWTVVHVDPVSRDHPMYDTVQAELSRLASTFPFLETAHDVRIVGTPHRFNVVFDVNTASSAENLKHIAAARGEISRRLGGAGVVINVDPPTRM